SGDALTLALMPFVSQRYAVKAEHLMTLDAAEQLATYGERIRAMLRALDASFRDDTVNMIAMHCTILGAKTGGGEREAQSIMDYALPATIFGPNVSYVALGHLHRTQQVVAP